MVEKELTQEEKIKFLKNYGIVVETVPMAKLPCGVPLVHVHQHNDDGLPYMMVDIDEAYDDMLSSIKIFPTAPKPKNFIEGAKLIDSALDVKPTKVYIDTKQAAEDIVNSAELRNQM